MSGLQIALLVIGGMILLLALLVWIAIQFPRRFVRAPFRVLLTLLYRHRVIGLENLPSDRGCVLISNHVSWIDGILILWMLPRNVRFIVDGANFRTGYAKYLASAFDTILMMSGPKSIGAALRTAREAVAAGDVVGIFPEGTITRTGQLQAFKPGLNKIVKNSNTLVVPIWLDGMWGSIFSFSGGKFFFKKPSRPRRQLTLYVGAPLTGDTPIEALRSQVQALGAQAAIDQRDQFPVLARRIIRVWRRAGSKLKAADSTGVEVSGRDLLIRTLALRRMLRREVFRGEEAFVGVLLPPSVAGVVVNVALAMDRRVSANLNYTVSSQVLNHCISELKIQHVLTSEKFLSKFNFDLDAEVVLLESLRERVSRVDKLVAYLQGRWLPAWLLDRVLGLNQIQSDDLLTVIFTSGSTGMPKGVLLSQANISHNVDAVERAVRLDDHDVVLGILPFFHSFGYSVTLWSVMAIGPAGVYHFNPLDARQVGKLVERYKATVLLGTPTFLRGYLRRVEPEQFASLDVVVVGAERMPADLFEAFEKRFGVRPVEGYGATELSPLVSVNIPPSRSPAKYQIDRREGSVGRPLPGVATRIVSTDDDSELPAGHDGMLWVTGPNLMRGYVNQPEATRKVLRDGWYVTGDIAQVDDQGFLHITGRLSRFSKIGGEMVPHVRIEEELVKLIGDANEETTPELCVTAIPSERKGERLIVLHKPLSRTIDELRAGLSAAGLPNLFIPSADSFIPVDEIPLLGTGKLDLKAVKELALQLRLEDAAASTE